MTMSMTQRIKVMNSLTSAPLGGLVLILKVMANSVTIERTYAFYEVIMSVNAISAMRVASHQENHRFHLF
jgi:hypothetical protein